MLNKLSKQGLFLILVGVLAFNSTVSGLNQSGNPNKFVAVENVSENSANLNLISSNLKNPITFADISKNVYYTTSEGKSYLNRFPDQILTGPDSWVGIWEYPNNNKLTFIISKDKDSFNVSLTASPQMDVLGWGFAIEAESDEYYTGLFERTVDGNQANSWQKGIKEAMDLRGQTVHMYIQPTVSLYCPFFISSRNYSAFVEGTWPGTYDFCKSNEKLVQIFFEGPQLSMIIDTAPNPAELVKRHSLRVGPTILPPKWTFRPWRWRDNHSHNATYYDGTKVNAPFNSEVVEDILMMKAFDIPCGLYWVDRPWATGPIGYDDFEWDDGRFPNAVEMIKWIHDSDMKFLLWIAPWTNGDMAHYTVSHHYHLKDQIAHADHRPLLDFSNPKARQWWQETGILKVLLEGVDGFKLDRAEEMTPNSREYKNYAGITNREYRNQYPVDYAKSVWEIAKLVKGDDFVVMPRAGYTNSSRYGVFWAGDIGSPPEGLRSAIIALLRSAVIGFPIWGSDTGGYWQGELDREVCARWLAFSCFSPIMEVGPTEDQGLWDMKKEPHYDTELIAIWRLYAILHDNLADYSYQLAVEARETGMPIARPLFLHWPEQKQAWSDWQTYTYGPDILVSAVWEKGVKKHKLYLPDRTEWIDAWSGKKYSGGRYIEVDAPLHKIPIFIRSGSEIKMGNLNEIYKESLEIASKKPDIAELEKMEFSNYSF